MAQNKFRDTTQFAALPWRIGEDGMHQVMLLTSRETRRWVIPKPAYQPIAPLMPLKE